MHLQDNITFAVVVKDLAWRTELTVRFCEYFSQKFNIDFLGKIIFPASIDDALEKCETDYLIVQSSGHIIFDRSFFTFIEKIALANEDIAVGYIELAEDYAILRQDCIFFNMKLWEESGKPAYVSMLREGDRFSIGDFKLDNKKPFFITSTETDRIYISHEASNQGAEIIAKQLAQFKVAKSFSQLQNKEAHLLDTDTAYSEIHSETIFEKLYLREAFKRIHLTDKTEDIVHLDAQHISMVVAPANGIKTLAIVNHFRAENVIVYDINPISLDFQKLVFAISKPTLVGELIDQFKATRPYAVFADEDLVDRDVVLKPLTRSTRIRYEVVDAFSFEMENLIKSFDDSLPTVFDIADIFTYPYNFYRRPMFQVEGLFIELFSLIKSRRGASFIIGVAPGYQSLNDIEINTSRAQYEVDPTIDPYAVDESIPEEDRVPIEVEPIMYSPKATAPRAEEEPSSGWVSALRKSLKMPKRQIVEIVKEVIVEKVVEKEVIVEKVVEKPVYIDRPTNARPSLPTVKTAIPVTAEASSIPIDLAVSDGFAKQKNSEQTIILTKNVKYDELDAIFEYHINLETKAWSFKVGKVGVDKRIEFSNGLSDDGLLKHLQQQVKINPKTAARYFQ
jgi:hypothetical protein